MSYLFFARPQVGADAVLPSSPKAWGILVAFGVLTIALAQFLFFHSLGRLEARRASLATAMNRSLPLSSPRFYLAKASSQ